MKIIVGMSGGVDSSVTALLLKQQGHEVEGMFMKNWEEDDSDSHCAASEDIKDAQAVCDKLDIPLHRVNFASEYWDFVFEYFLAEYKAGRTPNPDILCNKEIKFKAFLNYAKSLGADKIATGHYARLTHTNKQSLLLKGLDNNKDQSYFLYALTQKQIRDALFPIGELDKPHVRALASDAGFINHAKKDSTGICFIGERKFKVFLEQYLPAKPGKIRTNDGKIIGQHQGLMYYTIGQRKGIGLGGIKEAKEAAWFVLHKDLTCNELIVGQGTDHPDLYKSRLTAMQLTWVSGDKPSENRPYLAKTRYRQQDQKCTIAFVNNESIDISFELPQRAITPGQSVVLYDGDVCLGGGIIK